MQIKNYIHYIPYALGLLHLGFAVQALFTANDMEMLKHYAIATLFTVVGNLAETGAP